MVLPTNVPADRSSGASGTANALPLVLPLGPEMKDERVELELRGITKRFPGVVANDDVNLRVRSGEILGLLGENGPGKTTLMNILYGLYSADEGEILIDGEPTAFSGPNDAIAAGIGMVHQHFMLVPVMTVAENVVLGVEPVEQKRFPWLGLVGIAGATYSLSIKIGWSEGATRGFGWIALAIVIFGGWSPIRGAFGAILFGATKALATILQRNFPEV